MRNEPGRRTVAALAFVLLTGTRSQAEPSAAIDPSKVAEHLATAIRFKTVSQQIGPAVEFYRSLLRAEKVPGTVSVKRAEG